MISKKLQWENVDVHHIMQNRISLCSFEDSLLHYILTFPRQNSLPRFNFNKTKYQKQLTVMSSTTHQQQFGILHLFYNFIQQAYLRIRERVEFTQIDLIKIISGHKGKIIQKVPPKKWLQTLKHVEVGKMCSMHHFLCQETGVG